MIGRHAVGLNRRINAFYRQPFGPLGDNGSSSVLITTARKKERVMSVQPANWREIHARGRTNPINRQPPTRFPYVDEILRDLTVQNAIQQAWRDTNADADPITAACEQGGWIYMDLRSGRLSIRRKANH